MVIDHIKKWTFVITIIKSSINVFIDDNDDDENANLMSQRSLPPCQPCHKKKILLKGRLAFVVAGSLSFRAGDQ